MKDLKIHKAVHIHPLFFLLALSAFLTGAIYEFIVLFSIVFIHEMGHFLMARFHGWRVKRMEIWLFGGAVVSEEHNTRPFHEQVLVILAGPLQHIWIYGLLIVLETIVGSHSLLSTAFLYNGIILGFNMLPIWPLDGGKLLFYLSNCWLSFKKSLLLTLFLSIMFMILAGSWLFLDERWTLATILLTAFLLIENALEWKRRPYTQMRYLLYCAYQNREGLKTKYININQDTMVRDVLGNVRSNRHHRYVLKQASPLYIVDEQECLKAFFEKKDAHLKMKDIPEIAI